MYNRERTLADILFDLVKAFNDSNVKYVIIGGFAVIFHGLPRLTEDIDIAIDINKENLDKIKKILKKIFNDSSFDEIQEDDFKKYSIIRYVTPENFYIDFICNIGEVADFKMLFENIKLITVENLKIPILNEHTLIKLKEKTVREKDKYDTMFLRRKLEGDNNGI